MGRDHNAVNHEGSEEANPQLSKGSEQFNKAVLGTDHGVPHTDGNFEPHRGSKSEQKREDDEMIHNIRKANTDSGHTGSGHGMD